MKSTDNPLISILIPMFNAEKGVHLTLKSIKSQTFKDFEVIIVDDGSTDKSYDIARAVYPSAIIIQQDHLGVTEATNKGFQACSGEFIALIDCWDIAYPARLELQYKAMREHPNWGASSGHYMLFEKNGEDIGICRLPLEPRDVLADLLFGNCPLLNSGTIIRKQILHEVGVLDPYYFVRQDFELLTRISLVSEIANIDHLIMKVLNTTEGISYDTLEYAPFYELALIERNERIKRGITWKNMELRKEYQKKIELIKSRQHKQFNKNKLDAKFYSKRAAMILRSGDRRIALQEFLRALSKAPIFPKAWIGILACVILPFKFYIFILNIYKKIRMTRFPKTIHYAKV